MRCLRLFLQTVQLSHSTRALEPTAAGFPSLQQSLPPLELQYLEVNAQFVLSSAEGLMGTVGTLLLENPLGQNGLTYQGLRNEAAKLFGLRSRKLKLFLNETQMDGEIVEHAKFLFCLFFFR